MNFAEDTVSFALADSQHFFREGLRGVLEAAGARVVGEASDGRRTLALVAELRPDALVIDLNMPDACDATVLRKLGAASPKTRLVVLSATADVSAVLQALEAGASGYILKDTPAEDLATGIGYMLDGQVLLSREVARVLVESARAAGAAKAVEGSIDVLRLTPRELDVLRLIVDGADNAAIGRGLSISRHTAKQHVTNIFEKLGVENRVEAAVYAVRNGLA